MSLSNNAPCPCHSGEKYKRCCRPFHQGRPAPTPAQLMRSRYCAYALGLSQYIMDTTWPEGPRWQHDLEAWRASLLSFSRNSQFTALEILEQRQLSPTRGRVTFRAGLEQLGQDASFTEDSLFLQQDGRWLYHSGEPVRA